MLAKIALLIVCLLPVLSSLAQAAATVSMSPPQYTLLQANSSQNVVFTVSVANTNSGNISTLYGFEYTIPQNFGAAFSLNPFPIPPGQNGTNFFVLTVPGNFFGQAYAQIRVTDPVDNSSTTFNPLVNVQQMPTVTTIVPNFTLPGFNLTIPIISLPQGQNCSIALDPNLLTTILVSKEDSIVCRNELASTRLQLSDYKSTQSNYDTMVRENARLGADLNFQHLASAAFTWVIIIMLGIFGLMWVQANR